MSYRILMMGMEGLKGARRAMSVLTAQQLRERRALIQRMRYSSRMRDLDALKDSFDECYRKGWHASMIDTPVDERIRLPLHLAIGDLYADRGNSKGGELFLAIYPIGSNGASSGLYEHRVIASRLCTDVLDTESAFETIRRLVDGVGVSDNGTEEFLTELLGHVCGSCARGRRTRSTR